MTIKAVVFDLDDTLWDVNPVIRRAEQIHYQWLNQHAPKLTAQFRANELWQYRMSLTRRHPELQHFVTRSRMRAMRECLSMVGYSEADTLRLTEQAFAVFWHARNQIEPFPYALEALEGLKREYLIGALSNGNADVFQTPFAEYFDFALSAEGLAVAKPDPEAFHAMFAQLELSLGEPCRPEEIVFVGDNPEHDIEAAHQLGMKTIWVQVKASVKAPAYYDQRIDSLAQLSAAVKRCY